MKKLFLELIFRYSKNPNADDVYMTGSMTSWKCVKMSKPEGESYWVSIQDTREGTTTGARNVPRMAQGEHGQDTGKMRPGAPDRTPQ